MLTESSHSLQIASLSLRRRLSRTSRKPISSTRLSMLSWKHARAPGLPPAIRSTHSMAKQFCATPKQQAMKSMKIYWQNGVCITKSYLLSHSVFDLDSLMTPLSSPHFRPNHNDQAQT